ncbi:MAG: GTP-binding protein [Lachnospiraceae bacterium]|nr:GTP-binding protein [Lachnospiraceae bacterium]
MKPVYIINGFLESGKTEFITFTISQPYFQIRGKTLLIVCEEGEVEYDEKLLKKSRAVMEVIEDEEDFTAEKLLELEKEHKPERIVIEYNGMWNCKDMKLPWHWEVEQQITTVNGATFQTYYANMKSLVAEQVRKSELIIFNRCDGLNDQLANFKRSIKAVNPQAEIIFEDENGEINQLLEEDLPYDLNQAVIPLDNMGYGIWYLDSMDNLDRYLGKTVKFVGMVLKPKEFPQNYFVPGRMAMTCCADDMAFLGFACEYDKAYELVEKSWVEVTATVDKEYRPEFRAEGPVLRAVSVVATKKPKDEIISFT